MSMYTLMRNNPNPTEANILQQLDGNMCRCTGYNPIAAAVSSFAVDIEDFKFCKKVRIDQQKELQFPEELKSMEKLEFQFEKRSEENGSQLMQIKYFEPSSLLDLQIALKKSQDCEVVFYQNLQQIKEQKNYAVINLSKVQEMN